MGANGQRPWYDGAEEQVEKARVESERKREEAAGRVLALSLAILESANTVALSDTKFANLNLRELMQDFLNALSRVSASVIAIVTLDSGEAHAVLTNYAEAIHLLLHEVLNAGELPEWVEAGGDG